MVDITQQMTRLIDLRINDPPKIPAGHDVDSGPLEVLVREIERFGQEMGSHFRNVRTEIPADPRPFFVATAPEVTKCGSGLVV